MMKKSNLVVREDTIHKSGSPEQMGVEVEKTVRAYRIGQSTGLFRVPKVLDYDASCGTAVLERIPRVQSIRRTLTFGAGYRRLTERIARSLATIHGRLNLPADMQIALPTELQEAGGDVFLHGDFSFNNICTDAEGQDVIIFDWQMTRIHGGESTYGTKYFDIAWFLSNLFNKRLYHCPFSNDTVETAMWFLQCYAQASDVEFDLPAYRTYLGRFVANMKRRRRAQWTVSRKVLLAANQHLWRRYMTRLGDVGCV